MKPPLVVILVLCVLSSIEALTYRYFAYGSNMVASTLTALRQVHPISASAAILPDYRLRFNIGGMDLVDGAAASVQACSGEQVHGVVYELTPKDFARVGSTEGVPLAYRWAKCLVYPYVGDGDSAGKRARETNKAVMAYTLVNSSPRDLLPSRSYLDLLIQGAEEWKVDRTYSDKLKATPVARNLLVPDGLAGLALKLAELRQTKCDYG
jgi:hypothetical protein